VNVHDDSIGCALTRVLCGVGLTQRDSIKNQQMVHPRNSVLVLPLPVTVERMVDFCRVRYVA
jgi:hypothetical protein